MDKIRIGVIGVGHMGRYHVNILKNLKTVKLVGIVDCDYDTAMDVASEYNVMVYGVIANLLKDVDAVIVATPTSTHLEIGFQVLEAGVSLLIEKPIAMKVFDANLLISIAAERNLILQVGHVERFNGAVWEMKNIIHQPYLLESRRLAPGSKRIDDVGVVLDLMIHDLDIVLNLIDSPITKMNALGSSHNGKFEDIASAQLSFESGVVANFTASRLTNNKVRNLSILQPGSYINLDYNNQDLDIYKDIEFGYSLYKKEANYKIASVTEKVFIKNVNPLEQELLHFIRCVLGEEVPFVDGAHDIKTLQVANEILDKIKLGL